MPVPLQPLRVPAGWLVSWNTLSEVGPTQENVRRGYFSGSSLFSAVHRHRRLGIDVEWRPEDDPAGEYWLTVEYTPWERTEAGRRLDGAPLDFRPAMIVHEFRTRDRAALVRELEAALVSRREWTEHS